MRIDTSFFLFVNNIVLFHFQIDFVFILYCMYVQFSWKTPSSQENPLRVYNATRDSPIWVQIKYLVLLSTNKNE